MIAASRPDPPALDAAGHERLALALANRRSDVYALRWPWDDRPFVIAEPVLVDTEVRGAAVTVAPTDDLRTYEVQVWLVVLAAGLLALTLAVVVALPIVRWILRPVRRLDEGTGRVASAVLAGGAPDPVADGSGPPELRRLSVSFDRMAATVAQAYGAQRAFVADASHQLRNPLTALRLRLSNLDGHVDRRGARGPGGGAGGGRAALHAARRPARAGQGRTHGARSCRSTWTPGVDDRIEAWRPLAEHSGLRAAPGRRRAACASPATAGAIETLLDAVLDNAREVHAGGRVGDGRRRRPSPRSSRSPCATPAPACRPRSWTGPPTGSGAAPGTAASTGRGWGSRSPPARWSWRAASCTLSLPRGGGLRIAARLPRLRWRNGMRTSR